MAGAGRKRMRAAGARSAVRRAEHDRRTFIVRLVGEDPRGCRPLMILPGVLEFGAVLVRAVAGEKRCVFLDPGLDKIPAGFQEDRLPLLAIALEQSIAAPALQHGGELPAEIGDVVETVVETVAAIGRMRMRGVAGNEHAADLIAFRDLDAQVPEADIIEFAGEIEPG